MRSLRFFQITSKTRPTRGPRDSVKLLQKQDPEEVPEILSNYFENKTLGVSKIPSNYFKNETPRDPRDSFKLLQKHDPQKIPEILLNYFKSKTQRVYRFFQSLQIQDKEFPRFFDLLLHKQKSQKRSTRFY